MSQVENPAETGEAEKAGERLSLLVEASSVLIASTSYETALANLVHLIVPRLADWCVVDAIGEDGLLHRLAIVHRDPTKSELAEALQRCYPVLEFQQEHTITKTLNRGQSWFDPEVSETRLAAEARDAEHLRLLRVLGFASEMVVPLVARGQILGTLTFVRTSAERRYKAEDLFLAEELARRAAIAVDNVRLYEAERAARAEAEASQQRLALLAEMRERNRMAQELHDTVAQALGYLNLKIGMTHTSLASGHVDTALANLLELKQVISETYTDVREEIFNLRAKVLSGLSFMEVLQRYIDKYRRFYNLDIQLIQEADPALFEFQPEVTTQLVRTIQEALINIRKHAKVNQATIRLGQEGSDLYISIEDQGQGFNLSQSKEKSSSFGLQIMSERVASVGGSMEIETAPGQGTRIILRFSKR